MMIRDEYVGLQLKLLMDGINRLTEEWNILDSVQHFQSHYVDWVGDALGVGEREIRKQLWMSPAQEFPPGEPDEPMSSAKVVEAAAQLIEHILGTCPPHLCDAILETVRVTNLSRLRST